MFNKDDVGSGKVQSAADGRLEKSAEATKTRLHCVSLAAVLKRQRTALKCRRLPIVFLCFYQPPSWVAIAICLTIISARTECEEFGCGFECGFFGDGVVFVMALSYGI